MTEQTIKKTCDKHGEYDAKVMELWEGKTVQTSCPKCADEDSQKRQEAENKKLAEIELIQWNKFLKDSGMVRRYWNIKLDTFEPNDNQRKAYQAACKFVKEFDDMETKGQVLFFCGNVGTGKTMLAHAVLQSLGFGCYLRAIDISRMVRDCYSKNESEFDLIHNLTYRKMMAIDEVGVQQGTANESMLITDLIDRRYGELKPTIICSNLNEEKLAEFFGERAWDRLMQNGAIIPITGKSQRGIR